MGCVRALRSITLVYKVFLFPLEFWMSDFVMLVIEITSELLRRMIFIYFLRGTAIFIVKCSKHYD